MTRDRAQFIGYLKFFGPSVEEGRIDIEKIGNSLIALNKLYKKFTKQEVANEVSLKLSDIRKNCTEIRIFLECSAATLLIAKTVGLDELGRQFFGTIGQQIALKIFSKGSKLEKQNELIKEGKIYVILKNIEGKERVFLKEIYDNNKEFALHLNDLVQLEEKKEEKMEIGYYQGKSAKSVANIQVNQKNYFNVDEEIDLKARMEEDFDESKAEEQRIVGKFVDYYGLAHKYHFSFQARKNQDEIGKQKILCKTDGLNISDIIDLLKPENQGKNICIFGKATKNNDDKIDKIKIQWINEDENYNPNQGKLF